MLSRFDFKLLFNLASEIDIPIVCIGKYPESINSMKHKNIVFLGEVDYETTNQIIEKCEFTIIPHLRDELSSYMDPMKIFIYLSKRKKVFATNIYVNPELAPFIEILKNDKDFIARIKSYLLEPNKSAPNFPLKNNLSWEYISNKILAIASYELK